MTEGQGGGTPAGWYPDPEGNGERWWNGMSWGQLRQAPTAPQHAQHEPASQHAVPGQFQVQQSPPSGQWAQQQQGQGPAPQQQAPAQHPGAAGLRCVNCQFTDFTQAEYLLNTRGMSVLGFDAFNAGAHCLICRRCGFIHWFATR